MEVKFFDAAASHILVDQWTGSECDPTHTSAGAKACLALNVPLVGTGEEQREGRKYTITGIHIRGRIYRAVASDQADCVQPSIVRVVLYQDRQTNAAQSQGEQVFRDVANFDDPFTFRNLEYSKRFNVLWNKTFSLYNCVAGTDGANTLSLASNNRAFQINIQKKIVVNCNTTDGGTVADIIDNSLHLIACSTVTGVDTLDYCSRLRFVA
jgi:hypothetical protein